MKDTLKVINQMQADGVIGLYAIGGAVGATFYLEPVATLDLDVFVSIQPSSESPLISLSPIFNYLKDRGHEIRGEYVVIGNWPVQFLPPADPLGEEAIAQAVVTDLDGVPTRVMTAEHLVAIALQVGRAKDYARIVQFVESGALDDEKVADVLKRHGLLEKWNRFKLRYLQDPL